MTAPQTSTDESTDDTQRAAGEDISSDLKAVFGGQIAKQDEASLRLVVLRDVAIASALLSIFGAAETWASVSRLAFPALLSTINGLLVGAATGALAHEWGHFAGARLGGGHAPLKPISGLFPIFDFDYANNDKQAFDWMSIGGNLAHVAVPLVYLFALPTNTPGAAALVAGAVGFAVFSSIIEIPVIRSSRSGKGSLESLATIPRDFVSRTLPWAVGAALLVFLVL